MTMPSWCDDGAGLLERPLRARASRLSELPPPPESAARLLALVGQEDVDVPVLCREIERAPAIAARVVGVAGCAMFSAGSPVRSVHEAVVRVLGLQLVCGLVTGLALAKVFPADACTRFDPYRHWRRALRAAAFAREAARRAGGHGDAGPSDEHLAPDAAYLCGLLHNIGVLALVSLEPQRMDAVFAEAEDLTGAEGGECLRERIRAALGADHDEIGAALVTRWRLAPEVACAIVNGRNPGYRGPHWRVSEVVRLGRELADRLERGRGSLPSGWGAGEGIGLSPSEVDDLTESFSATLAGIDDLTRVLAA